jgi:DNA-binding response OmpR family regulator
VIGYPRGSELKYDWGQDVRVSKATILVVDDEPGMRELVRRVLGEAGYAVVSAGTLDEAKTRVDETSPDLLLVDVRLAAFNGLQLVVRERAIGRTRPIIVMSGHEDPVLVAEAERLGATFLAKPFSPAQLVDTVAARLAGTPPSDS